jgi:type II secretory pathway predicted ATPase ExeA/cell division septation protein DedD
MYLDHFGLVTDPFSLTPRLEFLYASKAYEETLAHLAFSLENGEAITLITGPIGVGKTLIIHSFLAKLGPAFQKCLVNTTQVDYLELLKLILHDLDAPFPAGADRADLLAVLKDQIRQNSAQGRRVLVVIDEAQDLSIETLEGVRLLTNLDQLEGRGLQVILLGQLDLERKIKQPELAQLQQRLRVSYKLEALTRKEVGEYLQHRMRIAGCEHRVFHSGAVDKIFQLSGGIPRLVNILASEALLAAYVANTHEVKAKHVEGEFLPPAPPSPVESPAAAASTIVEPRRPWGIFGRRATPKPALERKEQPEPADSDDDLDEKVYASSQVEDVVKQAANDNGYAAPWNRGTAFTKPQADQQESAESWQGSRQFADRVIDEKLTEKESKPPRGLTASLREDSAQAPSEDRPDDQPPPAAWTPTFARRRPRRRRGRRLFLGVVGLLVLAAAAYYFLGPQLQGRKFSLRRGQQGRPAEVSALKDADGRAAVPGPGSGPAAQNEARSGSGTQAEQTAQSVAEPALPPASASGLDRGAEPTGDHAAPARQPAGAYDSPAHLAGAEGYVVHICSFRTTRRADTACQQLDQQGYGAFHSEASVKGRAWHRVYVGPFPDTAEARRAIRQLRANGWQSYFMIMKLEDVL